MEIPLDTFAEGGTQLSVNPFTLADRVYKMSSARWSTVIRNWGLPKRKRRDKDYFHHLFMASPSRSEEDMQDLLEEGSQPRWSQKDGRRRRFLQRPSKRWLWRVPIILLSIFGFLHLLQVTISRARLIWDMDTIDLYLPKWAIDRYWSPKSYGRPVDLTKDVLPIPCHSHNDYWRPVPLYDALHWGCTSVEADVWLHNEDLYVGHSSAATRTNHTFTSMYVQPLVQLLDQMNSEIDSTDSTTPVGAFHTDPKQTLVLLIDFKTDGVETWPYVEEKLEPLRAKGYLTFYDGGSVNERPITVVGTGNTPFDLIKQNNTYRDIFFDAPLRDLWENPGDAKVPPPTYLGDVADELNTTSNTEPPIELARAASSPSPDEYQVSNSYYASVNFKSVVGVVWKGKLSPKQMIAIRGQIRGAKKRGLKARYWNTPAWPVAVRNHIWHVLMKEGADVLNVDDLRAAAAENWKARIHAWW